MTNELTEALVDGIKAAEMSLSEFCAACGLSEQLFRQVLEGYNCLSDQDAQNVQEFLEFHEKYHPPIPLLNAQRRRDLLGNNSASQVESGKDIIKKLSDTGLSRKSRLELQSRLAARTASFEEKRNGKVVAAEHLFSSRETSKDLLMLRRLASRLRIETEHRKTGGINIARIIKLRKIGEFSFDVECFSRRGIHRLRGDAFTDTSSKTIFLRHDVEVDLRNGSPRARFTATHELAHLILHRAHARKHKFFELLSDEIVGDNELQANRLAGFLMVDPDLDTKMPIDKIASLYNLSKGSAKLAVRFQVSMENSSELTEEEQHVVDDFCFHVLEED